MRGKYEDFLKEFKDRRFVTIKDQLQELSLLDVCLIIENLDKTRKQRCLNKRDNMRDFVDFPGVYRTCALNKSLKKISEEV